MPDQPEAAVAPDVPDQPEAAVAPDVPEKPDAPVSPVTVEKPDNEVHETPLANFMLLVKTAAPTTMLPPIDNESVSTL